MQALNLILASNPTEPVASTETKDTLPRHTHAHTHKGQQHNSKMPAPSQLSIATSALNRLVKEEASYHKEKTIQEVRIAKLEAEQSNDENAEYTLRQEVSESSQHAEYHSYGSILDKSS